MAGAKPPVSADLNWFGDLRFDAVSKGRHPLTAFRSSIIGERAPQAPTRLTKVQLEFHVQGTVPAEVVTRAIALSRDKYCSVWHSLRQDIELTTSFDITS